MDLKKKIIAVVLVFGTILIGIFAVGLGGKTSSQPTASTQQNQDNGSPKVVSTNPEKLEEATILPTQTVEVTFSQPIENAGEVKYVVDPPAKVKTELTDDRKTIKLIPEQPYDLGQGYTFTIQEATKFDNQKRQEGDTVFHYSTISYKGV